MNIPKNIWRKPPPTHEFEPHLPSPPSPSSNGWAKQVRMPQHLLGPLVLGPGKTKSFLRKVCCYMDLSGDPPRKITPWNLTNCYPKWRHVWSRRYSFQTTMFGIYVSFRVCELTELCKFITYLGTITYPIPTGHFWVDDVPNFPFWWVPCDRFLKGYLRATWFHAFHSMPPHDEVLRHDEILHERRHHHHSYPGGAREFLTILSHTIHVWYIYLHLP